MNADSAEDIPKPPNRDKSQPRRYRLCYLQDELVLAFVGPPSPRKHC